MTGKIEWESNIKTALTRAKQEHKHVLLDFFNPE